jgi:glycosyltransferase involved in cell wall biosynthesis
MTRICHMTSVHQVTDIRIFIKECLSLANSHFEVHYIVPGVKSEKIQNVNIHGTPKIKNRYKRMIKTAKEVYELALEIDADIYHFHDPELIPYGLKLKKKGKIVIYDIHEDLPRAILSKKYIPISFRKLISFFVERYENNSSKKFDSNIGATPYITERFHKINNNSININNFPLMDELVAENQNIIKNRQVCYVGGIINIRGIENIIKSSENINGDIVMAGPVSTNDLKTKLDQSRVKYQGIIDRTKVNKLLNKSIAGLVLFLPEPNHVNSQPNKMFEYMSAGIPVIASNFPLWKEIIENNDCGICVNPQDISAISEAIQWMLDNPEKAAEMGRNGRKAVETYYNWETESKKLIKLYEDLLNSQVS